MTFGEAYTFVKNSMELVKGEWVTKPMPPHKEKMSKEEASRYYNKKLFNYWANQVGSNRNKEIVSALMFGHVDKYKEVI